MPRQTSLPALVRNVHAETLARDSDRDLLTRFIDARDESAFAVLLQRHGPTLASLCRRWVGDAHLADDVLQATFLVLARRAKSIRRRDSLASWLFGVAQRIARQARLAEAARSRREQRTAAGRADRNRQSSAWNDLLELLDEELQRLPDRHRLPLLLCSLQGRTQDEAASQLGWSLSTVRRRLEQGRALLQKRLARRGAALGIGLASGMLAPEALTAEFRERVCGMALGTQPISVNITALVSGGMSMLRTSKLLICLSLAVVLGATVIGTAWQRAAFGTEPPKSPTNQSPGAEVPPKPGAVEDDPLPDKALLRLGTLRFKHPGGAAELALSPDGTVVVSDGNGMLIAWNAATGKQLWAKSQTAQYSGAGQRRLAFAPGGKRLMSVANKDAFAIWDIATGASQLVPMKHVPKSEHVSAIDVAPDGKSLAVGTAIGVFVVDLEGNVLQQIVKSGSGPIDQNDRLRFGGDYSFARFSPDGRSLAVATSDIPKSLRFYDPATGMEQQRIELTAYLVQLAFSPDSKRVVVTERDNSVRVYEVDGGKRLHSWTVKLDNPYENYASAVAFSPDGKLVAAGATDLLIYLWDVATGKEAGRLSGSGWYPWGLAFSPDGQMLYSTGWDGVIRRWDIAGRKQLPLPEGLVRGSSVVATSPDGKLLAFADDAGTIRVVDARSGHERRQLATANDGSSRLAFSSNGRLLAVGGSHANRVHVILWDLAAGKVVRRWDWEKGRDPHSTAEDLVFSPDDKQLAVAVFRRNEARILDVTGDGHRQIQHPGIYGLDFAPDGATLATAGWDKVIRLWDPKKGVVLNQTTFEMPNDDTRMYAVRYSPDGRSLATADMYKQVQLWDAKTLQLKNQFEIDGNFHFNALAYSPDGLRLATGDGEGHVRVWDSQTGAKLWEGGSQGGTVYTVGFGRDDRALLAGGNGIGYLWDTRPRDLPKKDLAELWNDLNGTDVVAADRAFWALADQPGEAVTLFSTNVHPKREEAVDVKHVAKLIDQLADAKFAQREAADTELVKLGFSARPYLKKAFSTTESAETRQRLSRLLNRLVDDDATRRRYQRLVGVLAQINSAEARKLLHDWADAADSLGEYAAPAEKRCGR